MRIEYYDNRKIKVIIFEPTDFIFNSNAEDVDNIMENEIYEVVRKEIKKGLKHGYTKGWFKSRKEIIKENEKIGRELMGQNGIYILTLYREGGKGENRQ